MENDLLYITLKNSIIKNIYDGIYKDGEAIPSERNLAIEYDMSRVTVRKALDLLKREGILKKIKGKGTIVSLNKYGHSGKLNIIALVAPAQRRFFATFIHHFQRIADKNNTLVVFIQQSENEPIKDTLFKLLQNDIHNVVLWLDYENMNDIYIQRLRGLGMNIVFFDIIKATSYADCVCLDNSAAITSLYNCVSENGNKVIYISREDENTNPSSYQERRQAFEKLLPYRHPWDFQWDYKKDEQNDNDMEYFLNEHLCSMYIPCNIICSDGELGIMAKEYLNKYNLDDVCLVCLDDFPGCEKLNITVYRQPYDRYAEKIYDCLKEQNNHPFQWKADVYRLKGELVVR